MLMDEDNTLVENVFIQSHVFSVCLLQRDDYNNDIFIIHLIMTGCPILNNRSCAKTNHGFTTVKNMITVAKPWLLQYNHGLFLNSEQTSRADRSCHATVEEQTQM